MARILIIEDNQDIHALIKQSLGQEHELVSAFAGTEGLLYCQSQPVDLVLLDYMLPGMNGQAVLEAIRAAGHYADGLGGQEADQSDAAGRGQ